MTTQAELVTEIEANTARIHEARQLVGEIVAGSRRTRDLVEELARIATSDDDAETRRRLVQEAEDHFEAGMSQPEASAR